MKTIAAILVFVVVTLLLRSTALTTLAARGVVLDVLAFATVIWALRNGEPQGTTFGFILGLAADLDAAHWLGRHALLLSLLGYVVGRLSHTLVRDSTRTHLALLVGATALHQGWSAAFEYGTAGAWGSLLTRVLIATVATSLVGALLLALVRRVSGASLFGNVAHSSGPAA